MLQTGDDIPGDVGVLIGFAVCFVGELRPVAWRDNPDEWVDVDEARIGEVLANRLAGGDVGAGERQ